ncbi:glycosyltransferase family 9 protein [Brevundimonas sp.]|uniref:glycosyltransferase family 9 protein n=1 Tax=Brevundimonas sp. TaxID=1871086 RepID=UPI002ABD0D84|nr:glycosyltransferase family 9 protein [Brevundimonas sp.]MDZ4363751.1 glycosyltransferase family 9 protein [Brevundimonas sp.]
MTAERPQVLFVAPDRIGDCVIASGVIREIDRQVPGAAITVACGPPAAALFRSAPGVVRVIVLHKKKMAGHWIALWRQTFATRWAMVIDIRGSLLAWQLRAKVRKIYNRSYEGGRKVQTASRMMGAPADLEPEIFLDDKARRDAGAVIAPQLASGSGPGPILALAPTSNVADRAWPTDRWATLIARLADEPGLNALRFMVVGGPGDEAAASAALAAAGPRGINAVGKADLLASAAAIDRAVLFVGNDSGLMHVAAALGRPTLGLFGPSEWWQKAPWGPHGRVVAANPVEGQFAPIEDLDVDRVFQAVLDLYDAYRPVAVP